MRNKFFIPLTAIALFFAACSQDGSYDNDTPGGEIDNGQIAFRPMEIGSNSSEIDPTRAIQTTTATITTYGVSSSVCDASTGTYASVGCGSYFYNEEITAATGRCKYYWPGSSYKISFFGYAPYGEDILTLSSAASKIGFPVYSYTVPAGVAAQLDFMTADVLDRIATPTTTPVTLTFKHRCSDIRFSVTNRNPNDALTLKSISLVGMKYAGTFEGETWTLTGLANTSSSHPFTFTTNTEIAAGATIDATGTINHFMVLPQTISSGTDFIIVKTTEYGAEKTYTYTLDSNITLEKGKSYTFSLIIGNGELVVDPDTDINDWEVVQVYLTGDVDINGYDDTDQSVSDGGVNTNPQDPEGQNVGGSTVGVNDWQ